MLQDTQIENLMTLVASLDRDALIDQFHNYRANFPVDFTDDFFDRFEVDKLRHIFVAMCLQSQRLPDGAPRAA
jgi:hypothetical protein